MYLEELGEEALWPQISAVLDQKLSPGKPLNLQHKEEIEVAASDFPAVQQDFVREHYENPWQSKTGIHILK